MQIRELGFLLAATSGMLGVVQGLLNATVGKAVGPYSMIIGVSAAQIAVAALLAGVTRSGQLVGLPHLTLMAAAGSLGVVIMFGISYATGRVGALSAFLLVIAGQIAASAIIDHFGLMGAPRHPITLPKAGSVLLIAAGVYGFMKASH